MSKRKRKTHTIVAPPRNPLFNHPMMKKSHAHHKPDKAKRRAEKIRLSREWYSQNGISTFLKIPFPAVSFLTFCY